MTWVLIVLGALAICALALIAWMAISMLVLAHRIGEGKPRRRRSSDTAPPRVH